MSKCPPPDSELDFCSCFEMHLYKFSLVPWCVSVCQRLWFQAADGGKKGGGNGEVFPSISKVLVPLADTRLFFCSLPECCLRVLAQSRAVVEGTDRETGSDFTGLVSRGSGAASIWDNCQSFWHVKMCIFPLRIITVVIMLLHFIILTRVLLTKVKALIILHYLFLWKDNRAWSMTMKYKLLYRKSKNSSEIMFPAVSLPMVVIFLAISTQVHNSIFWQVHKKVS